LAREIEYSVNISRVHSLASHIKHCPTEWDKERRGNMSSEEPGKGETPSGWYANPTGSGERYWDGKQWTEQVRESDEASSRSLWGRIRGAPTWAKIAAPILLVVIVAAAITLPGGGGDNGGDSGSEGDTTTQSETTTQAGLSADEQAADEQALAEALVPNFSDSCTSESDDPVSPEAIVAVECKVKGVDDTYLESFEDATSLNKVWARAVGEKPKGNCEEEVEVRGTWSDAKGHDVGRLACFSLPNGNAAIFWTDDRGFHFGGMFREDGDNQRLYQAWAAS
jgi:hypothetical protein